MSDVIALGALERPPPAASASRGLSVVGSDDSPAAEHATRR